MEANTITKKRLAPALHAIPWAICILIAFFSANLRVAHQSWLELPKWFGFLWLATLFGVGIYRVKINRSAVWAQKVFWVLGQVLMLIFLMKTASLSAGVWATGHGIKQIVIIVACILSLAWLISVYRRWDTYEMH